MATILTIGNLRVEHHPLFTATYMYGHLTNIFGGSYRERASMVSDDLYRRSTRTSID